MLINQQISSPIKTDTSILYTDANGLSDLKLQARTDQDKALPEVAKQFESIFIGMMLKSMRQASLGDAMVSSSAIDSFRDMHDQQMSIELAKGKGFGIAESIVKQLRKENKVTAEPQINPNEKFILPVRKQFKHLAETLLQDKYINIESKSSGKNLPDSTITELPKIDTQLLENQQVNFASAKEFVNKLWPMAEKSAKDLGVKPEVLLAQAALETGWGQSIIKNSKTNSLNLFNIKADSRWDGDKITKLSLEYEQGHAVNKTSFFRVYDNLQDSFDDYVKFIKNNPRYEQAMTKASDPEQYLHSIHKAGYATDPNYVEKIMRVMNSSNIKEKLSKNT
ncbi:MAG: flagellar assembly peptidoglycan hydrolase FlgJ [Pseudomonadota bacterium]